MVPPAQMVRNYAEDHGGDPGDNDDEAKDSEKTRGSGDTTLQDSQESRYQRGLGEDFKSTSRTGVSLQRLPHRDGSTTVVVRRHCR